MKKVVADILTKKVIFFMVLCCSDTVLASMHRGLSMHQKRLIASSRWQLSPSKIAFEESKKALLKMIEQVLIEENDEKPCETKTRIVFIEGWPAGLRSSLYLEAPCYQLGLEFTRSAMQPQCNLEDSLSSLKKQKKLEQLFKSLEDGLNQDNRRKEVPFIALCLERDRKRDFAVWEWEKEEERRELRTKTVLPIVQERKLQKDQFKQNRKQEQKKLKQQLCVTFQKNKKLPKSQQQVKQIAHRKRW